MKALVVDDNQFNRQIFQLTLESIGYTVVTKADGVQCLEALHADQYDIVILDLEMPELDGVATLKILRASKRWANLLVIVVTAYHHMVSETLEGMADYILEKPIDVAKFRVLVQRVQR